MPIDSIARRLKQSRSAVTTQARTPALGLPRRRQSAYQITNAAAKGAPAASKTPHPFTPTKVAEPSVPVPEPEMLDD